MDPKLMCFVVCAILGLSDAAYVDSIKKCPSKDDECVAKTVQTVMKDIGAKGLEELHIRPFDPMNLAGLTVPVLGMLNITVEEGSIKGIKDCVINRAHDDFDARQKQLDLVCDLEIKTKLKFDNISPVALKLFGGEDGDKGSGYMEMKISKIHMKLDLPYDIIKKDDGEIYIVLKKGGSKSEFDIGKLHMKADKILVGKQDLTELVEKIVNENWNSLVPTFGNGIFDVAVDVTKDVLGNFYENVPAKYYYTDDLTSYV